MKRLVLGIVALLLFNSNINAKTGYVLLDARDTQSIVNVMKKDGIGDLTFKFLKRYLHIKRNKYQVKTSRGVTYKTFYVANTTTMAGKIVIFDGKSSDGNNIIVYDFQSNNDNHNYNTSKIKIANRMLKIGLGDPQINTNGYVTTWAWEWKQDSFNCTVQWYFDHARKKEEIMYSCKSQY